MVMTCVDLRSDIDAGLNTERAKSYENAARNRAGSLRLLHPSREKSWLGCSLLGICPQFFAWSADTTKLSDLFMTSGSGRIGSQGLP